jgi:succinate dehydrogenase/fumarate reductase flavoprotein subunit
MTNQPWYNVALQVYGAIMLGLPLLLWLLNRGRKQANTAISKTEGEIYKHIIENRLAELNIQEIIDKKTEQIEQKYEAILMNVTKEHFETKLKLQEKLESILKEKVVVERENELLHKELSTIKLEHEAQQREIDKLKKEVAQLKLDTNGKSK